MVRRRGPRLTAAQKAELWRRWREGDSLRAIGRSDAPFPSESSELRGPVGRGATGGIAAPPATPC